MAVQFFGQYLLEKGLITAEQVLRVIEYQELQNLRIGEFAIRQGLLTESDASRVNQLQLSQDIRFGEAAIQLGVLEEVEVQILLAAQRNSHIYFGEAVALLRFAPNGRSDQQPPGCRFLLGLAAAPAAVDLEMG